MKRSVLFILSFFMVQLSNAEPLKTDNNRQLPDMLLAGIIIALLTIVYLAYFITKARNKRAKENKTL